MSVKNREKAETEQAAEGDEANAMFAAHTSYSEEQKKERFQKLFASKVLTPETREAFIFQESEKIDSKLISLAFKYAPILKLHPKEPYLPTSHNWYLKHVGLKLDGKVLKEPGSIQSPEDLYELRRLPKVSSRGSWDFLGTTNPDLQLFIPKKNQKMIRRGDFSQAKCYAYSHTVIDNNQKYIEISYSFFYAFNGNPISSSSVIQYIYKALKAGHHDGDIEHITVRLKVPESDKEEYSVAGIHFAAHAEEGMWFKHPMQQDLDGYQLQGTQPLVWSSLELHASYNRAGSMKRKLGFWGKNFLPPDITSDGGPQLDCQKNLVVLPFAYYLNPQTYGWIFFNGRWGSKPPGKKSTEGPFGIIYKDYIIREDPF